jgi:ribonucleoside-diphosphate reductase alpha chain
VDTNPGESLPDYFITAGEVLPADHLKMQEVFQEFVDSAVSKTINFPKTANRVDFADAYMMAFDMNIKGITVYRDGCRAVQVLNKLDEKQLRPQKRPETLPSTTHKITTGLGNLYITVSFFNGSPFEVFCSIGKSGYSTMADAEAIGRLASLALRSGISTAEVVSQLKGIGGSEPTYHNGSLIQSIPDAIALALEKHTDGVQINKQDLNTISCPFCGASLADEKCPVCPRCGWTRCTGT